MSPELNQLCTPSLFKNLELDHLYSHSWSDLRNIHANTIPKYGTHVRSIRIHLGKEPPGYIVDEWQFIISKMAQIVFECRNATSIALYYTAGNAMFDKLAVEIIRKIEASVAQLGIYSTTIMGAKQSFPWWDNASTKGPVDLLRKLLESPSACHNLHRLDLVMENLPTEFLDTMTSRLCNLRSLTIRRTLRNRLPRIWQMGTWAVNNNLKRLQLMGCVSAHAADMPSLVRHFRGLQELVWATCGHHEDTKPEPLISGWSLLPQSLPSVRPPLKLLHIEHAVQWEIMAMSQIPAEEVVVTNHDELLITHSLCSGVEMFIGLKTLRVLPPHSAELVLTTLHDLKADRQVFRNASLDSICEGRGVALYRDAEILFPCSCCVYT